MNKKEKREIEWKKDFEVLFGDVDNKYAIKVFIQDLLQNEAEKVFEKIVDITDIAKGKSFPYQDNKERLEIVIEELNKLTN